MELALLRDVGGRDGGPLAPAPERVGTDAPLDTDRAIGPTGGTPSEDCGSLEAIGGAPAEVDGRSPEIAGVGVGPGAAVPVALTALLGSAEALGGGGVDRTGAALLGSFLLTHFFKSLS